MRPLTFGMTMVWTRLSEEDAGKAFAESCSPSKSTLYMILSLSCAAKIIEITVTTMATIADIIEKVANKPYHLLLYNCTLFKPRISETYMSH
jgi:hypothetical protein